MKTMFAFRCVISLACVLVAGWLAFSSREGWGWFLFVGLCCLPSYECGTSVKDGREDDAEPLANVEAGR